MPSESITFETDAGRVADELAGRGIAPDARVRVTVDLPVAPPPGDPNEGFWQARAECRAAVEAAGLSDEDIDRLIEEAREDVWREKQACA